MRVVIASRIFTPEPSAASFILHALADRLAEAGHEVVVLTTTPPSGLAATPAHERVRVRRWPVIRDRSGYVRGYIPYMSFDIPLALRLLFTRRADVYFVEPPPTTGAVVRVVLAVLRRPYVYDAADIWSDAARLTGAAPAVIRVLRRIELFAMRGARRTVTISTGVSGRMRELGIETAATVVGFGADVKVFRFQDAGAAAHAPYVIYAGSYSEWHGAEVLVDAFAIFAASHPEFGLVFVGNGSARSSLEQRAHDLGLDSVRFLDAVSPDDLRPLLANAVMSVATQKPTGGYEYAFASKVYSSMASGCPVVFCGPGPTADFIAEAERSQRSGASVHYDAALLAEALADLAGHPLTSSDRRALAAWTAHNYSMDAVADRMVATVEESAIR